eukprot:1089109-Rhodomonas_salina.2
MRYASCFDVAMTLTSVPASSSGVFFGGIRVTLCSEIPHTAAMDWSEQHTRCQHRKSRNGREVR